jgi:hypothetical protein
LAEATPSSRVFQWFTKKLLGPWLIHKAKTEELKMEVQQLQTGLTGLTCEEHWSDRCATT